MTFDLEEARIHEAYARRQYTVPADLYSAFNRAHLYTLQQLERRTLRLIAAHGFSSLANKTICEIGCGGGYWLRRFVDWGANPENLFGFDLLENLVAQARHRCPVAVNLECANAASLPLLNSSCDLVAQFTVFSSILDVSLRRAVAMEMLRILRPGGLIVWYDTRVNNPSNIDVRGIRRRELQRLFPVCRIELEAITLAPPINRILADASWLLSYFFERVPLLRTHYLGAITKL